MKLEGKFTYEASQEEVWNVFNDPKHLQEAIPGCEKLELREPGKYDASLKIGIAAVKGRYVAEFEVADPEPPNRYRLIAEGSGFSGFVKGEGIIEFLPQDQSTIVSYRGEVQVGGLIAGVGQRLIGGIAKMMLGQFFKTMRNELKSLQ